MAHHGNSTAHKPVDHHQGFRLCAFELHPLTGCFLQKSPGGGHGSIGAALVAEERQVTHHWGVVEAALHCRGVMHHRIEAHRQGGGVAQGHHGQGIAHQHQINAG